MLDTLMVPGIDPEDVEQERHLRRLEGRGIVSRFIIYQELARTQLPVVDFSSEVDYAGSMGFLEPPTPSFEMLDKLLGWAWSQSPEILEKIRWFLDSPEDRLVETLEFLRKEKVITTETKNTVLGNPGSNFTDLLRRQFHKYKTLEWAYLKALVRREMPFSERQDKPLYQSLKVLQAEGLIEYKGNGVYRLCG